MKRNFSNMYLFHPDIDDSTTTKMKVQSQLLLTVPLIPVNIRVPGLAVTLTQLSSNKSINNSYINKTEGVDK